MKKYSNVDQLIDDMLSGALSRSHSADMQDLDVDAVGRFGRTPLLMAAALGLDAAVQWLVESGASIDRRGIQGTTALHEAASSGHIDVVVRLLDLGTDVNVTNDVAVTPLMCAAASGHLEVVRLLLSRHATLEARDYRGQTALDIAIEKDEDLIAEYLKTL